MLDEPFSHIMPVHVDAIKEIMEREKKNKGILITDHLYEHLMYICDDIYLLKEGKAHPVRDPEDIETLGYANLRTFADSR